MTSSPECSIVNTISLNLFSLFVLSGALTEHPLTGSNKQMLLFLLCPHNDAAGSDRTSVWHSQYTCPGGGVRVPVAAAGGAAGGRQHPGAGESVPEGREHHTSVLLSETHLLSSGNHIDPQQY